MGPGNRRVRRVEPYPTGMPSISKDRSRTALRSRRRCLVTTCGAFACSTRSRWEPPTRPSGRRSHDAGPSQAQRSRGNPISPPERAGVSVLLLTRHCHPPPKARTPLDRKGMSSLRLAGDSPGRNSAGMYSRTLRLISSIISVSRVDGATRENGVAPGSAGESPVPSEDATDASRTASFAIVDDILAIPEPLGHDRNGSSPVDRPREVASHPPFRRPPYQ